MMLSKRLAALLLFAPLAACATASPQTAALRQTVDSVEPVAIEAAPNPDTSLAGLYLAGNAAVKDGRNDEAADYFTRASELVEADGAPYLREKAFNAAVVAGEIERAAQLAPGAGDGMAANQRLGRLVVAVDDLAKGDAAGAHAILKTDEVGQPYRGAALLLRPWAAAASGDVDPLATIRPEGGRGDRLGQAFTQFNRALVLEHMKKNAEAEEAFKALLSSGVGMRMFNVSYGEFLERQGRRVDAVAVYDALLKIQPEDRNALKARARASARRSSPPPMLTIREAAAQALLLSATSSMAQSSPDNAQIYLQLALRLDPERPDALLLAGGFAEQKEDYDDARAIYARISPDSAEYLDGRARIALTYRAEDNLPKAVEVARETARLSPNDRNTEVQLADLLRATDDNDGAVKVLTRVINAKNQPADWRLLYSRAVAQERAGRWPDAEKDLMKALEMEPDQPDLMNYLGYSWADRGEHLDEALNLLQRAVAAQPNSGAIIDSLGWVYFRRGESDKAVELLEKAVEMSPSDPDINDHLGDAYAQAPGRRLEALFQWERVLTLQPDDTLKAEVQAKIAREHTTQRVAVVPVEPINP